MASYLYSIPNEFIHGVYVKAGETRGFTLCVACFCDRVGIEEDAVSKVTRWPQSFRQEERYLAMKSGGICARCRSEF